MEKQIKITTYEGNCPFCKTKFQELSEAAYKKRVDDHLRSCKIYSVIKKWEAEGITKEMVALMQGSALDAALKKLVKKYGLSAVKQSLEILESLPETDKVKPLKIIKEILDKPKQIC